MAVGHRAVPSALTAAYTSIVFISMLLSVTTFVKAWSLKLYVLLASVSIRIAYRVLQTTLTKGSSWEDDTVLLAKRNRCCARLSKKPETARELHAEKR